MDDHPELDINQLNIQANREHPANEDNNNSHEETTPINEDTSSSSTTTASSFRYPFPSRYDPGFAVVDEPTNWPTNGSVGYTCTLLWDDVPDEMKSKYTVNDNIH